jgi:dTDP-4-amino-4,6-dideoxygalactose transaminase
MKKQIKLFHPYVNDEARRLVQEVLSGRILAQGPMVEKFEEEFAKTFGFEKWQVVSLNSGTSALELAYELTLGTPDDFGATSLFPEVITPVLTCTATNIPLVRMGAQIVFADVEGKNHLNIDPEDVKRKITDHTKAIVFVHFGGSSEGLEHIEVLAATNRIDLICDAAQALGSPLSNIARFNCVSLQAIKSLTAGDGGVLICRDMRDAEKARKLRWFGYDRELKQKVGDTDLDLAGYKYHMNDINAAIALGNLKDWEGIKSHREAINAVYASYGKDKGYVAGIWNPCVVNTDLLPFSRLKELFDKFDIEIGQYHYRNDKYKIFSEAESVCPTMDQIEQHYFMLPCHMDMTVEDADRIARIIWT